ncbi:MAG: phosphatidylglycerophosphatase A [Desulfuromonadaceae bacterium]|nr:phosphatidylglycerophosphatase A [Desulfuromonadaceae bacterium]
MPRWLTLFLATNGGLGYAPVASGTIGTLAGLPLFWLVSSWPAWLYGLSWLALLCLSFVVADAAGKLYQTADDGRIVIDELVGYLVTVAFLPCTWWVLLGGFCWFRVFDIFKPWPASYFDKEMKNGVGVVLDDVVAGVYGAVALRLCLWLLV